MTIKGTLETFNLRELLQMLSFNQKVGTLYLDTEAGPRTIYVDRGRVAYVAGDVEADNALYRVLRRTEAVPEDRMKRALEICSNSESHLGEALDQLHAAPPETLAELGMIAVGERFLTLQLTSVSEFEFLEGQVVAPNGMPSRPLEPWLVVDGLLLDLTRKMDQWAELCRFVPGMAEIYEHSGIAVDLSAAIEDEEADPVIIERVLASYDGFRDLHQVVEVSFADELCVMLATAMAAQAGVIRPVPTHDLLARGEDLVARGEAERAIRLLRRTIDREDAPPEAHARLGDALVALGSREEAASEFEAFAELTADGQPPEVFDALSQALALRDGDPATAARLCDFYLRNRPWLDERREFALEALRALIHGAVSRRQPLEAANRLQEFIRNGDAPNEDLLVLADLYAAGGDARKGAAALYARAEELLGAGRTAAGRDLLERTLHLDPGRADARSRLHMIQGANRLKRRRRRVMFFLLMLSLLLFGAGAAWWSFNRKASDSVRGVRASAEASVASGERQTQSLMADFQARLDAAATSEAVDAGLADASDAFLEAVRATMESSSRPLYEYAAALDNYPTLAHSEANLVMLRTLEARQKAALSEAEEIVSRARQRGRKALDAGQDKHTHGRFREARGHLLLARNLAFDNEAQAVRAGVLLGHVDRYIAEFEAMVRQMRSTSDTARQFRLGVELLAAKLDSDLTRDLRLPVRAVTNPPGAQVRLGGKVLPHRTPCVIEYSPFSDVDLELRLPGRVPHKQALPDFRQIADSTAEVLAWTPVLDAVLDEGPCWHVASTQGPFARVWKATGIAYLLTESGHAMCSVRAEDGLLGPRRSMGRGSPARLAGTLPGGVDWRILGRRTLAVRCGDAEPWQVTVVGRLTTAPASQGGILVLVDGAGMAYGLRALTGDVLWRRGIGARPNQGPMRSALGILVSSGEKGAAVLEPTNGAMTLLPVEAQGFTYALPLGDGAVVLGGGSSVLTVIQADRTARQCGRASPTQGVPPHVGKDGVAWVEDGRVRWLGRGQEAAVEVPGLGTAVTGVTGDDGLLVAIGRDGVLRATYLAAPAATAWRSRIPGTEFSTQPLLLPDHVLVLADGGLFGIAR